MELRVCPCVVVKGYNTAENVGGIRVEMQKA